MPSTHGLDSQSVYPNNYKLYKSLYDRQHKRTLTLEPIPVQWVVSVPDASDMVVAHSAELEMRVRMKCLDYIILLLLICLQFCLIGASLYLINHKESTLYKDQSLYWCYIIFIVFNILHIFWSIGSMYWILVKSKMISILTVDNQMMRSALIVTIEFLFITRLVFVKFPIHRNMS